MSDPVLVLGGAGFIGRHLVEALAADGQSVISATRRPASFDHPSIENVVAAFDDPADFAPLLRRSRAVVHAATASTPGSTAGKPLMELSGNLNATLGLLTALQDAPGCRLVYLSSGGTLYGHRLGEAVETDMLRPRSYHGAGKAAVEHFISAWSEQYGGSAVTLRPSNVYGPGQAARRGFGIIPAAFDCIRSQSALTLWGDGSAIRDYIYIDDFIRLCLVVLAQPAAQGAEIFNASSAQAVSLTELLGLIQEVTGEPLNVTREAPRAVDIQRIAPSNAAARQQFDWQPAVPLAEGLRRSWQWFLAASTDASGRFAEDAARI